MTGSLVERVASRLSRLAPADASVLVAVSGGPDSVALLDLLVKGRGIHGRTIVAGHVDHGIHPDSGQVARHVADLAERLDIPFTQRRLGLGPDTTETIARRHRRAALRELARQAACSSIALAHHADDQVETVLLRVLRGSGPAGLAGMAPRRGIWLRPVLDIPRTALLTHLRSAGLSSWHDPANEDPRHLRSWLRTAVLPLLLERDEAIRDSLLALAGQAAADRRAWNQVPELLESLELRAQGGSISVAAAALRGYRSEVQGAVLRALGRRFGVPLGAVRIGAVTRLLAGARSGARLALAPTLEVELAFDRLVLRRPTPAFEPTRLEPGATLELGSGRLRSAQSVATGAPLERTGNRTLLATGEYLVRPWRPGDRIRPLGGRGSRAVAETFKECRVARGERAQWPVVVDANDEATVVWVPGICRSDARIPPAGAEALDVEFTLA